MTPAFAKWPATGLVTLRGSICAEAELDGGVAVLLGGADLGDHAGPGLDDGDRDDPVVVVEDLGHPELGAQDALDDAFVMCSLPSLELDLDVDAGRQVEPHQRVDGLRASGR